MSSNAASGLFLGDTPKLGVITELMPKITDGNILNIQNMITML